MAVGELVAVRVQLEHLPHRRSALIAGRQRPRATSVCVFAPGSTSSSRAAICEFEPGEVMSATTVGEPISV